MENRIIRFRAWNKFKGEMYDPMPIIDFTVARINAITLMQFTGLQDKNGKDIYEGDIVTCFDNAAFESPDMGKYHTGIISYTPPLFSLKIPGKLIYDGGAVKQWENDVYLNEWDNAENIEVIGNIYEHKNLLTT